MLLIILFVVFLNTGLHAITNYSIALDKYAQGMSFSNEEKEYLEKVGHIITTAIQTESHKNGDESVADDSPIMDPETFDQLDFVSKKGEGLFYPKDIKTLYACKAFLSYLGATQTNNLEVLQKRRSLILYLQKNPELKTKLFEILGSIEKDTEEAFLNLSKELTEEEKRTKNEFFLNRSLDNYSRSINLVSLVSLRSVLFAPFLKLSSSSYLQLSSVFVKLLIFLIPQKISTAIYNGYACVCSENPAVFRTSLIVPSVTIFGLSEYFKHGPLFNGIKQVSSLLYSRSLPDSVSLNVSRALVLSLVLLPAYFSAKKDYQAFTATEKRLISAQKIFSAVKELDQLLQAHPEFFKNLSLKKALQSNDCVSSDTKASFVLKQFHDQKITTPSFTNYWLNGSRMVVNKILSDDSTIIHKHFFPLLARLGEIQAYSVLANQLKNYSIPEFSKDGIRIQLMNFVHPNFPHFIPNSLDWIASKDKRFVFVSGSNGAGKSAVVRALLASIAAAQMLGFVSAQKGTLSLFDKIYFAANLSDDLGIASKFQVELAKLKNLHEYLEKNPEKKVLLVMDEPLTTTDSAIAGKVLFRLFTFLAQYPNLAIISISNNSNLKNFKNVLHMGMRVDANPDGTFKPTYKCTEGHAYFSDVMAQFLKVFGNKFGEIQETEVGA